jgi:hypothetical protein
MGERPIARVENHNEAEVRHGCERNRDLARLSPRAFAGRWRSSPHDLAEACWESGWDAAVIAMRAWLDDQETGASMRKKEGTDGQE